MRAPATFMVVLAGAVALASAPAQAQQGPVTSGGAASRMIIGELPIGIALNGTLPASAPPSDGRPMVWYTFACRPGWTFQVDVTSSWENVVAVLDPSGQQVAFEDDSTHPHVFTCRFLRTYLVGVGASSAAKVGRYTVRMNERGIPSVFRQAVPIPQPVVLGSISVGATVAGEATRDWPMYGEWAHTAFYRFQCQAGQAITVGITNADNRIGLTALLTDSALNLLAIGISNPAEWTCATTASYLVGVGAMLEFMRTPTGAFTLRVLNRVPGRASRRRG